MAPKKPFQNGDWLRAINEFTEAKRPLRGACPRFETAPKAALALLVLFALGFAGCREKLETRYGERTGQFSAKSVNGTAVLADMFEQAGFRVTERMSLSPRLERADTIVWFPDDFAPPKPEVRKWLNKWLGAKPDRTLIYVGRDFDAAPWYWKQVEPDAPADQRELIRQSRALAEGAFKADRQSIPEWDSCDWFAVERELRSRKINVLGGDPDWTAGIDPAKLEIELNGRMLPTSDTEVVLSSRDDMLVGRQEIGKGQLFVVANGSFLLNAMLVNHEHRKLAARLIDAVGSPKGRERAAFLESGTGGPPIRDDDPSGGMRTGLEIFQQWPTNWILMQLAVVGILFCFSKFLIFGRPVPPDPPGTSDFGKHVAAVASLLRRSRDLPFALARAKHFQQLVKKTDMKE